MFSKIVVLILISCAAVLAHGQDYTRSVDFDWEPIEGAKSYEVEVQEKLPPQKTSLEKVSEAAWKGKLKPGKYQVRLRARDKRNVPGDWSDWMEMDVQLESVRLLSPAQSAKIKTDREENIEVTFAWKALGGVEGYKFELRDENDKVIEARTLTETNLKLELSVAQKYQWRVFGFAGENLRSEAIAVSDFTLIGKKLLAPEIKKPESDFVRSVSWTAPKLAEEYDYLLTRLNPTTKKHEVVTQAKGFKDSKLDINPQWPGGQYRLSVLAKGKLRESSVVAKEAFNVRSGDRSPAAEFTALIRKSIDRVTGWYGVASYLITMINYQSENRELNKSVTFSAVGGTGRLGLGFWTKDSPWGFLSILDLSGFNYGNSTLTFASAEASALYRLKFSDRDEVRLSAGPYFRELPEIIDDGTKVIPKSDIVSAIGVQAGAEYWYSLTPKLGLQFNAHIYRPVQKGVTPSGQEITSTMSFQYGVLGSYRVSESFTGLIGYTRREDSLHYRYTQELYAVEEKINETTVTGDYFNIFAEYAF